MKREQSGFSSGERLLYRVLLPHLRLLAAIIRAGYLAERVGLRRVALRIGARRAGSLVGRAAEVAPPLPRMTGRALIERERRKPPPTAITDKAVYFLGCSKDLLFPDAALATYRVLRRQGIEVETPRVSCCGLPCLSAGDQAGARSLALRNLQTLGRTPTGPIVVDESSCCAHLMRMHELFPPGPHREALRLLGERVVDLTVFLDRRGIRPPGRLAQRVVWHDPCQLKNHQDVVEGPRNILRSVPGTVLVEVPADDCACCGGAGAVMLAQPALSDAILARRIEAVRAAGADTIITGSPSCTLQFMRARDEIPVLYLSQYLEIAYSAAPQASDPLPPIRNSRTG